MKLYDQYPIPTGIVEFIGWVDGKMVLYEKDHNVVTYAARSRHNFASAGEVSISPISHLAVGTGGYGSQPVDSTQKPPAADPNATGLRTEIYRKPIITPINHTTQLSSVYTISLGPNEVLNAQLTECGLFTESGMLYAIRHFKPVSKIERMILDIRWTLLY